MWMCSRTQHGSLVECVGNARHGGGTAAQIAHIAYPRLAVDSRKKLAEDPTYRRSMCRGLAKPIDRHPFELVNVDDQDLQVVDIFCSLVDTIFASGGSSASITTRCRPAWRKFTDFQGLLINKGISLHIRESIYTAYKCSTML